MLPDHHGHQSRVPTHADSIHELTVHRLILNDDQDQKRIELGITAEGEPAIMLFDRHGHERIRLGLKKFWIDGANVGTPMTESELKMTGDDNNGHGNLAHLMVGHGLSSSVEFELRADRNDINSNTAFIEVDYSDDITVVMTNGAMSTSWGLTKDKMTFGSTGKTVDPPVCPGLI